MCLPPVDVMSHASEVVCVSIGANLLLPVAPAIMGRFFSGIEVDAGKIVERNFGGELGRYISDWSLRRIGAAAVSIRRRQAECGNSPGLFWRVLDVMFAIAGVFLLWSGWIDRPAVATLAPALFLPAIIAAGWPFLCYVTAIARLHFNILLAGLCAGARMLRAMFGGGRAKADAASDEEEIAEFASRARKSIDAMNGANSR